MRMIAVDRDTRAPLDTASAQRAADNPNIWTWVDWVPAS